MQKPGFKQAPPIRCFAELDSWQELWLLEKIITAFQISYEKLVPVITADQRVLRNVQSNFQEAPQ